MSMRTRKLELRGLQFQIQEWGDPSLPKLFLLHGWMDCGASFKFMVPELLAHYHVIAPDLRGFGETDHAVGGYWFPDYYADLEALLEHYSPHAKVDLIGHSMGGNIVMMYAGIRPDRVSRVLSLESFGLLPTSPDIAADRYRKWLLEVLSAESARVYPNANALKRSIHKGNPRLSPEMIDELASLWGKPVGDDGAMMLKHDHAHRYTNPVRYNYEDTKSVWRQATAKLGVVAATESPVFSRLAAKNRVADIKALMNLADENYYELGCGHMVHLEQPQQVAAIVLDFFKS